MPFLSWEYEEQHLQMKTAVEEKIQNKLERTIPMSATDIIREVQNSSSHERDQQHKVSQYGEYVSSIPALFIYEESLSACRESWRRTRDRNHLASFLFKSANRAKKTRLLFDEMAAGEFLAPGAVNFRRTLHQSHYWSVNCSGCDRQQVVRQQAEPIPEWRKHETWFTGENRWKTAKLLMVDQIWLWIVDGNTLITMFPERYGLRADDSSSVHAALRLRLKNTDLQQISTASDLAVLVLDELSSLGLARSPDPVTQRLSVLDLFSNLISDIVSHPGQPVQVVLSV